VAGGEKLRESILRRIGGGKKKTEEDFNIGTWEGNVVTGGQRDNVHGLRRYGFKKEEGKALRKRRLSGGVVKF